MDSRRICVSSLFHRRWPLIVVVGAIVELLSSSFAVVPVKRKEVQLNFNKVCLWMRMTKHFPPAKFELSNKIYCNQHYDDEMQMARTCFFFYFLFVLLRGSLRDWRCR
jgi:hypothetical protein